MENIQPFHHQWTPKVRTNNTSVTPTYLFFLLTNDTTHISVIALINVIQIVSWFIFFCYVFFVCRLQSFTNVQKWQPALTYVMFIFFIALDKRFFQPNSTGTLFFIFLHNNVCGTYTLPIRSIPAFLWVPRDTFVWNNYIKKKLNVLLLSIAIL